MTCCALGDQDAMLGHVASRGDRISPSHRIETRVAWLSTGAWRVTKSSPFGWNRANAGSIDGLSLVPAMPDVSVTPEFQETSFIDGSQPLACEPTKRMNGL